jgi:inosine/xanthosine triphosphate pyrophosphatase family protein
MAKKLFLGTTNPVKVSIVRAAILPLPVDLLIPGDLRLDLQVAETGQTIQQNAEIKALAYYKRTGLPTLAIDGGLWIEKFPAEKQPGHLIKRIIDAHELVTEQAVLYYYVHELAAVGGKSACTWEGAVVLALPAGGLVSSSFSFQSILTSKPHGKVVPGLLLSPITINPQTGRYESETPWDERLDTQWVRRFITEHLNML